MAGLKVGDATISMGAGSRSAEGRTVYGCFIDLPDGSEHEVTDLRSGCQGGGLQRGFEDLLSFLSAAGESFAYAGHDGENSGLFPRPVTEWAAENRDELSMLLCDLEESETELIEA